MIEVLGKMADRVADQLRGLPQVRALHTTNGQWDFIAELEDRDLASFDETLRRIRLIDGINPTEIEYSAEDQQDGILGRFSVNPVGREGLNTPARRQCRLRPRHSSRPLRAA